MDNGRLQYPSCLTLQCTKILLWVNFFYTEFSKEAKEPPEPYTLKPGLYTSISEIVNAMNDLISDRRKRNEKYITAHVDKITQQVNISLRKDISSLVFCSNDLTHIFGVESLEPDSGLLMYGIGPHKNQLAYEIVRIHSLMIYTDLVEYNIIGDTKAPLLRCIPFFSKIENETNIISLIHLHVFTVGAQ